MHCTMFWINIFHWNEKKTKINEHYPREFSRTTTSDVLSSIEPRSTKEELAFPPKNHDIRRNHDTNWFASHFSQKHAVSCPRKSQKKELFATNVDWELERNSLAHTPLWVSFPAGVCANAEREGKENSLQQLFSRGCSGKGKWERREIAKKNSSQRTLDFWELGRNVHALTSLTGRNEMNFNLICRFEVKRRMKLAKQTEQVWLLNWHIRLVKDRVKIKLRGKAIYSILISFYTFVEFYQNFCNICDNWLEKPSHFFSKYVIEFLQD